MRRARPSPERRAAARVVAAPRVMRVVMWAAAAVEVRPQGLKGAARERARRLWLRRRPPRRQTPRRRRRTTAPTPMRRRWHPWGQRASSARAQHAAGPIRLPRPTRCCSAAAASCTSAARCGAPRCTMATAALSSTWTPPAAAHGGCVVRTAAWRAPRWAAITAHAAGYTTYPACAPQAARSTLASMRCDAPSAPRSLRLLLVAA
mmetsp:Transcript_2609/g.7760  ORF Transcript_2609/g.7760 Transcript_2609/m.7760 type:complete len:205 (-) Transcript_2609:704-1318(-)